MRHEEGYVGRQNNKDKIKKETHMRRNTIFAKSVLASFMICSKNVSSYSFSNVTICLVSVSVKLALSRFAAV